ncbi:phosphopantetheine-binding protein [Pectobacteriaceae bacterium CE70]|nr:phosphopantetheine-binding protein [Prodigiosinella sp. LS101]WJV59111.1 phosphopantetheine-binding protein [Pectobacteriaceae bacterium C111]WJV63927.1 phosphopantetheine-binding protein [Pectobacteriaceae bacterium C52]WJV68338.1 phosphopantetheine-binding protein [Pectobacteriaceae bacterium CE70]WJY12268.1 phosphopantetheine-binding protein [Pectobacteriaceae bacterium C80]WJV54747.1 phosphopantetheine-binding protein [Prodigiosinella sp. LS101]
MMNIETLITMLAEIGVPNEVLEDADGSWQLRQDLGLTSAETVALQVRLQKQFDAPVSLWSSHDYTLDEIVSLGTRR